MAACIPAYPRPLRGTSERQRSSRDCCIQPAYGYDAHMRALRSSYESISSLGPLQLERSYDPLHSCVVYVHSRLPLAVASCVTILFGGHGVCSTSRTHIQGHVY